MRRIRRIGDPHATMRSAHELKDRLGRYATLPRFNEDFEEGFEYYFGGRVEIIQGDIDEASFSRFMEWFIHDYVLRSGQRLIELFELELGADLSRPTRHLLRRWSDSHLTLLELAQNQGETYRFRDLLTGGDVLVSARGFKHRLLPWSIVVGRPLPVGRRSLISPGYTVLPPAVKLWITPLMRGEYRRWHKNRPHGTSALFLRENGHLFNDFLTELEEWIASSVTRATEAQQVVRSRAVFKVRDKAKARERLIASDAVEVIGEDRLLWYRDVPGPDAGETRLWAELSFAGNRLSVTCWSTDMLQEAKAWVSSQCTYWIRHLLDVYQEQTRPLTLAAAVVALDGSSTPLERVRLIEALKQVEYATAVEHNPTARTGPDLSQLGQDGPTSVVDEGVLDSTAYQMLVDKLTNSVLAEQSDPAGDSQEGVPWDAPLGALPSIWNSEAEAEVVACVRSRLVDALDWVDGGTYSAAVAESAAWIWWSFCRERIPRIQRKDTWAAALYYVVSHVEQWGMTQAESADTFGVSQTTVSRRAREIQQFLELTAYDDRFSVQHPLDGLLTVNGVWSETEPQGDPEDGVARGLTLAAEVRSNLFDAVNRYQGLKKRAYAQFLAHVPDHGDHRLDEAFLDWFHLDWRVPVLGGRTLARVALDDKKLQKTTAVVVEQWIDRSPSFYRIKNGGDNDFQVGAAQVADVYDDTVLRVERLLLPVPCRPGDIMFARLVAVDDVVLALGPAFLFREDIEEDLLAAIDEERKLVSRWTGEPLSWTQFRAHHAERLYGLAFRFETGYSL